MENSFAKRIIDGLLIFKEKVFYCQLPRGVFVGLRCSNYQKLCDLIRSKSSLRMNTPFNFIQKFLDVERKLHEHSHRRFNAFAEQGKTHLTDPRFEMVRTLFERKVVDTFVEAYF